MPDPLSQPTDFVAFTALAADRLIELTRQLLLAPIEALFEEDTSLSPWRTSIFYPPTASNQVRLHCAEIRDATTHSVVPGQLVIEPDEFPGGSSARRVMVTANLPAGGSAGLFEFDLENTEDGSSQRYVLPFGVPGSTT